MTNTIDDRHLVGDLYDAAIDPDRWTPLLDRLARNVGAKGSCILSWAHIDAGYSVAETSSLYHLEDRSLYAKEYSHHEAPVFNAIAAREPGTILIERQFFDHPERLAERPDVRFLRERYGVFHRLGMRLNEDRGRLEVLTCQFADGGGHISDAGRAVLRTLGPHLTQTFALSRTFFELRRRYRAVLAALDRVSLALFVVTDRAFVVVANGTAERLVGEQGVLALDARGRFLARDPEVNAAIRAGIADAAQTARHAGGTAKRLVAVPRGAGRDPCLAEISPLHDADAELDGGLRGALISVVDPELRSAIDLRGFDVVYGLTEAESAVAALLVDGLSNKEIAETRGVGLETVNSQISALLKKTGSRNRTELVRRALMLNLPIERDDTAG